MNTIKINWGYNSYEFYKLKKNKIKTGLLFSLVFLCLVTPFTNWIMIPAFKLLNKFPLWLYK